MTIRKKSLKWIVPALLLCFALGQAEEISHPLLRINAKFIPIEKRNAVSPYMTMIYALDLLENNVQQETVKNFINWYLDHLNKIDRFGVSGTVYDYNISKIGLETSSGKYDSADGYAGMFLYLVKKYYDHTGDDLFIRKIFGSLQDTMYLIYHLKDTQDGLIKALPYKDYKMKYLMDNVESYIGVGAYIFLARLTGQENKAQIDAYLLFQHEIKNAILEHLYDPDSGLFFWAKEGTKKYKSDPTVFYPDMFAQMHLLAFFGENLTRERAAKIWQTVKVLINKRAINMGGFRQMDTAKRIGWHDPQIAMEQLIIFEWAKRFALKHDL